MPQDTCICWFRKDLRLDDNPMLAAAAARRGAVVPVFIWDPEGEGDWSPGAASRWWLHQSLNAFHRDLRKRGSRLIVRRGLALAVLRDLVRETKAATVLWNRRYEPAAIKRDTTIKAALREDGLEVETFNASLLFEPWEIQTKEGSPYKVYTPFSKACFSRPQRPAPPAEAPRVSSPDTLPSSLALEDLGLLPEVHWYDGLAAAWSPGESGAHTRLGSFIADSIQHYDNERNRPDQDGSSRLSPHLHFGELSPRRLWQAADDAESRARSEASRKSIQTFKKELLWREFAHHLLFHFPGTPNEPLRPEFANFPWTEDETALTAWQEGRTGYPIVDAGMRQLWSTGWMHNRVRMIAASLLVKDLLLPWQEGARWFWDTLVDADLANNTLGWQWTAGCGADAAPFFRIFNPVLQGEKFDPHGDYVRRWVPELQSLPGKYIHKPWLAPAGVLENAGLELDRDYRSPIVDHADARRRALVAFEATKR